MDGGVVIVSAFLVPEDSCKSQGGVFSYWFFQDVFRCGKITLVERALQPSRKCSA